MMHPRISMTIRLLHLYPTNRCCIQNISFITFSCTFKWVRVYADPHVDGLFSYLQFYNNWLKKKGRKQFRSARWCCQWTVRVRECDAPRPTRTEKSLDIFSFRFPSPLLPLLRVCSFFFHAALEWKREWTSARSPPYGVHGASCQ